VANGCALVFSSDRELLLLNVARCCDIVRDFTHISFRISLCPLRTTTLYYSVAIELDFTVCYAGRKRETSA